MKRSRAYDRLRAVAISVNEDGFSVGGHTVPWEMIQAIATYKRDLFSYDDVCLAFQISPDSWVEVSEEQTGFEALIAKMERRYPAVPRDWFEAVVQPPFVLNYRILWSAAGNKPSIG